MTSQLIVSPSKKNTAEFEQQLNMPLRSVQHDGFLPRQSLRRQVGHEQRPTQQLGVFGQQFTTVLAGFFTGLLTTPMGDFVRNSHRDQTTRQAFVNREIRAAVRRADECWNGLR